MKYAHTNIVCRDWKRLSEFYMNTFRCEVVPPVRRQSGDWLASGTGVKNASLKGVHLLLPGHGKDGPTLEIYQYDDLVDQAETVPNMRGLGHLAFEVDNVQATLAELLQNGGTRFGNVTTRHLESIGELTFVYCRDPEGNLIELQSWNRTVC
ncbi:MAG: VOC family protein [Planctomycetota bacterium]